MRRSQTGKLRLPDTPASGTFTKAKTTNGYPRVTSLGKTTLAPVAQGIEHSFPKAGVGGSNPLGSAFLLVSLARCLEDEHAFIVHLDLFPVRELHVQWLIIEIVDEIGSLSVFDKHVGEEMVGRDRSIVVTETV